MELKNNFNEMTMGELEAVDGGLSNFFDKVNPLNVAKFIYEVGQDMGASSVKIGREIYGFYSDVKKIFK